MMETTFDLSATLPTLEEAVALTQKIKKVYAMKRQ
jgi:hypothetical protein